MYFTQTEEQREDYSHLPPAQQKKKLTKRLDEIRASIYKERNER